MAMGIYVFGPRALTTTLVSVIFCEIFEWGYCKLMHKPNPCGDLSAAITGVLLVFVCPVTLPYWTIIIGDFFAIVVVKQLFGGLGTNFLNPALAGRAFLMLCYPVPMTTWVLPGKENWASVLSATDAVTGATPLAVDYMKGGIVPEASVLDMFIGNIGGCVGEVSAIALLIGGIYLIAKGVVPDSDSRRVHHHGGCSDPGVLPGRPKASTSSPGCSVRFLPAVCSWAPSSWRPTM